MRRFSGISTVVVILCGLLAGGCNSSTTSNAAAPTPVRCVLTLSGTPPVVESGGGTGTVALTINRECTWSAKPEVEWISVSPANGQGESQVSFSVARNQQPIDRKGAIVINEQRFEVTQRAACVFTLSPTEATAGARGERLQVTVTAAAGCAWQAVSQASWITISAGASGTGPGTVALDVSANGGDERTGDVRIAGVTFTVRQSAPSPSAPTCQVSLSASSVAIGSAGGSGAVDVNAPEGCQWTAQSSAAWLDVTSGRTGDGRGEVRFAASPNTSPAPRTATLTIAGIEFRVTQAAAVAVPECTYSLSSTTESVTAAGGTGAITVTAPSECTWTATSAASWLTVTAGASGSGNGTVQYSAAAHTGTSPRSASLTIAAQTVTVNQAGAPLVSSTLSGAISSLQGQCPTLTFVVNARTVRTTSSTNFRGGPCNSIDDGDDVTVEGSVGADNSITATIVRRN